MGCAALLLSQGDVLFKNVKTTRAEATTTLPLKAAAPGSHSLYRPFALSLSLSLSLPFSLSLSLSLSVSLSLTHSLTHTQRPRQVLRAFLFLCAFVYVLRV